MATSSSLFNVTLLKRTDERPLLTSTTLPSMENVFPLRSKLDSVVVSPDFVMTKLTLAGMPGPLLQPAHGMSSLAFDKSAETF